MCPSGSIIQYALVLQQVVTCIRHVLACWNYRIPHGTFPYLLLTGVLIVRGDVSALLAGSAATCLSTVVESVKGIDGIAQ